MKDYKLRLVTAAELMAIVNQGTPNVTVKVAHERAHKHIGNFYGVLELSSYLDNEMLTTVTSVSKKKDGDSFTYGFTFDASPFEKHNLPYERAQFYSVKNHDVLLTAREVAKEAGEPFSMVDELFFDESESFYLVENHQDFLDYATEEELEKALLEVKYFVADAKDNESINKLVQLGFFARKTHLGTITEIEKRVYHSLLSKQ